MKQIIVMIAMLILGIGVGGMVIGFSAQAEAVSQVGVNAITEFTTEASAND